MISIRPLDAKQMTEAAEQVQIAAAAINIDDENEMVIDRSRCVNFTTADLQSIINMAAGGSVQFQFAKNVDGTEKGQSTLVIAFPIASDGNTNSFFKPEERRICPPPDTCMLS